MAEFQVGDPVNIKNWPDAHAKISGTPLVPSEWGDVHLEFPDGTVCAFLWSQLEPAPVSADPRDAELSRLRRANALAVAALTHLREGALARRDEYAVTEIDYVLDAMHAAASADAERVGDGGAT